jgi:hypothetical protein
MKTADSLIPYILMSLHPLMHASLLTTGLILLGTNYETFYLIDGTVPETKEYKEAYDFISGKKYTLMNLAITAHAVCLLSHWLYQILNHYEIKVMANVFLMLKMMFYFIAILRIQSSIDFTKGSSKTDNSQVMAWLTFEVLTFYLNIVSMAAFILINNFKKFKSIRDRVGLAGDQRKTQDFLVYSKDDIHWWSCWFTQLILCILALVFRNKVDINIKWSVVLVFTKHAFGAFLIRQLYFNSKFQFKTNTKTVLILTILINVMLILKYRELKTHNSSWWAPIVLNDIVLYFLLFGQMFQEYLTWSQKNFKWRQDQLFDERFLDTEDNE